MMSFWNIPFVAMVIMICFIPKTVFAGRYGIHSIDHNTACNSLKI